MSSETILIVDDNPRNIQIVGNMLAMRNIQIAYATSGAKALELTDNHNFDLILLDIMMPEIDGYEVCQKLRMNEKTANVPIIFLTAKTDTESVLKGFSLGASDYVTKPFNSAELMARVETHLELFSKKKELAALNSNLEEQVQQRTEQLRQANQQLARLDKAKSDFLSIMGHELRSPLNGVIGLTSMLSDTQLDQNQREYIEALMQTAQRLARFSETALLITSLQSGIHLPDMHESLLHIPVELAISELTEVFAEKQIKVSLSLENESVQLPIDSDLMRRCVSVILENAAYHLPKNGQITVTVKTNENQSVELEISDNGFGFPADVLDSLNDFMQNKNLMLKDGTGLSLAAVKLIIDAHSGRIQLGNKAQGGAFVRMIFHRNSNHT